MRRTAARPSGRTMSNGGGSSAARSGAVGEGAGSGMGRTVPSGATSIGSGQHRAPGHNAQVSGRDGMRLALLRPYAATSSSGGGNLNEVGELLRGERRLEELEADAVGHHLVEPGDLV